MTLILHTFNLKKKIFLQCSIGQQMLLQIKPPYNILKCSLKRMGKKLLPHSFPKRLIQTQCQIPALSITSSWNKETVWNISDICSKRRCESSIFWQVSLLDTIITFKITNVKITGWTVFTRFSSSLFKKYVAALLRTEWPVLITSFLIPSVIFWMPSSDRRNVSTSGVTPYNRYGGIPSVRIYRLCGKMQPVLEPVSQTATSYQAYY